MTYTNLTLGTPKFKPRIKERPVPMYITPCLESLLTGPNVLVDPSLESQLSVAPNGPAGDEIPSNYDYNQYKWSDNSIIPYDAGFQVIEASIHVSSYTSRWRIISTSPRTGTYHLRYSGTSSGDGFMILGGRLCAPPVNTSTAFLGNYTAFCEPGSSFDGSFWAKAGSGTPSIQTQLSFYNHDGDELSLSSMDHALTTSYSEVTRTAMAPSSSSFVVLYVSFPSSPADPGTIFDYDDFVIGIT